MEVDAWLEANGHGASDEGEAETAAAWCKRCRLFSGAWVSGMSAVAKDAMHVSHSYGNPIWSSRFCVRNLWLGGGDTDLAARFGGPLREVRAHEVDAAREDLRRLGEPRRESDREALAEAEEALSFCERWLGAADGDGATTAVLLWCDD